MTDEELDFIVNAVKEISENHEAWAKDYIYDSHHNEFRNKKESDKTKTIKDWFSF
jgi:hypothetical protein